MKELTGDTNWYCNDKEMVSSFFTESCVVGLNEKNSTFPTNLYSFCSKRKIIFQIYNLLILFRVSIRSRTRKASEFH